MKRRSLIIACVAAIIGIGLALGIGFRIRSRQVIQQAIQDLASRDMRERGNALDRLEKMGSAAARAVPSLLRALNDERAYVRASAAAALGRIGASDPVVVSALLKTLKDERHEARGSAAWALGKVGLQSPEVVPALIRALDDERRRTPTGEGDWVHGSPQTVIHTLVGVLETVGHREGVFDALLRALADPNRVTRLFAVESVGKIGPRDVAISALGPALLREPEAGIRRYTRQVLKKIGPENLPTRLLIDAVMSDADPANRRSAASQLGEVDPNDDVVLALTRALSDLDGSVRAAAVETLGETLKAREAVPDLIQMMKDPDCSPRNAAAEVLGRFGAQEEIVSALAQALGDAHADLRMTAATTLGRIGPEARGAVPALIRALKDADYLVRDAAAEALGRFGAEKGVLSALRRAQKDKDPLVAGTAADAVRALPATTNSRTIERWEPEPHRFSPGSFPRRHGVPPCQRPPLRKAKAVREYRSRLGTLETPPIPSGEGILSIHDNGGPKATLYVDGKKLGDAREVRAVEGTYRIEVAIDAESRHTKAVVVAGKRNVMLLRIDASPPGG